MCALPYQNATFDPDIHVLAFCNEYFIVAIGCDTAENEPSEVPLRQKDQVSRCRASAQQSSPSSGGGRRPARTSAASSSHVFRDAEEDCPLQQFGLMAANSLNTKICRMMPIIRSLKSRQAIQKMSREAYVVDAH